MRNTNFQFLGTRHSNGNSAAWSAALICLTASLAIAFVGCQKSDGAVAVKGHVNYKSAPLNSGTLTFFPTNGRAVGAAISRGNYTAELAPGEYTVAVSVAPELPPGFKETDTPPPPKIVLPETYTSRAKSTLKANVGQKQAEPIDFDLK
jgi:hypothetical protein